MSRQLGWDAWNLAVILILISRCQRNSIAMFQCVSGRPIKTQSALLQTRSRTRPTDKVRVTLRMCVK